MVLDRTEIDALAKDCGLYIVEGRVTIGLAIEHPLMEIFKDFKYCERKDIVVKFHERGDEYEFTALAGAAYYDTIKYHNKRKRAVVIAGETGDIWYGIAEDQYLTPELIIKAIAENLKLRLDDLMKGRLLSKKKKHMNEIKNCGGEYDA